MLTAATLFPILPATLRDELLKSFEEISAHYAESRWEPSELNGGKFCEVVYSIINGVLNNNVPANASKPANMLIACQALEQIPSAASRVGDRSLRILIPRMLPVLYEIRNNRGVGHVGGDVSPNFLDATAVHSMSSWVLAELIRIFHQLSTNEAQEIVDALIERKHPLIWAVAGLGISRVLNPQMSPKDQVLVLLHGRASWVGAKELCSSVEYSSTSMFRTRVLQSLHDARLIEFDKIGDQARLSPLGVNDVEKRILKTRAP